MPLVRWNLVVLSTLLCLIRVVTRASSLHDTVSVSSDGWRPIVGKSKLELQDEITLYKNPSQTDENSEPVKAQTPPVATPSPKSSTKSYQTITATQTASVTSNTINSGNKQSTAISQHSKHYTPFHLSHGHGPHIPLTPMGYKGSPHRIPIPSKHIPFMMARPMRGPHPGSSIAHSMRHEVIIPAPSAAIGSFTLFNNHPPGFSKKPFSSLHALNDPIFQHLPVQSYLIQNRNPVQIDGNNVFNHNDEYTRNLVPPPYKEIQQAKEKPSSSKSKEHPTVVTEVASTINNPTLIIGKHKDLHQRLPDAVLVQLPPTFEASQFEIHSQKASDRKPVEIQVTKERLNVFHNSIPNNYNPQQEQYQPHLFQKIKPNDDVKIYSFEIDEPAHQVIDLQRKPVEQPVSIFDHHKQESKKTSEQPHFPTYEVTEGKQWQEPPQSFFPTRPSVITPQAPIVQADPPKIQSDIVFLPTPYRSDSSVPTSPTQSDVSAIYNQLNLRYRQRQSEVSTENPYFYNIKEVSTHYPILGKPESPTIISISANAEITEFSNDITGSSEEKNKVPQIYQPTDELEPTTLPPVRNWQEQRHRPQQRRRRPTQRPRTTTEESAVVTDVRNVMKIQNSEEIRHSSEDQRPQRRRRPTRVRTTTTTTTEEPQEQTTISSKRHRTKYEGNRVRSTTTTESVEELPLNHKLTETISYSVMQPAGESYISSEIMHPSIEDLPVSYENEVIKVDTKFENLQIQTDSETYSKDGVKDAEENIYEREVEVQTEPTTTTETTTQIRKRTRYPTTPLVTESQPFTTPVRSYEVLTELNQFEPSKEVITIQEIYTKATEESNEETTILPVTITTTTTTTTEVPTTTRSHRIRTRPIYDNKNRPRFSVKEYRQRLSQYSTTSTEIPSRSTTEVPVRSRFPNRTRRPIIERNDNETTERSKFVPKEPRHSISTTSYSETTPERKVNTRLRPFGRQRTTESTTTSPTTQKVLIKPNIFLNSKRPPTITLRQRIYNKYNRTNTLDKSTTPPDEEDSPVEKDEAIDVPLDSTHSVTNKVLHVESSDEEEDDTTNTELMRNDVLLQSQRVSDLTSSAHKEYETPGLFKSVSPNTRIVPSYFTLSTDDPILPIEAFFTNLKDKKNES
ncbi:hypothetical protein RI129_002459 [Pyrocoelia pectoralis]|uniref:Uncharacterized protein n=1 Tax=Pyrocoelia pectoralis TaxID=417401 RepID=A0AAN7ZLE0_9COLE